MAWCFISSRLFLISSFSSIYSTRFSQHNYRHQRIRSVFNYIYIMSLCCSMLGALRINYWCIITNIWNVGCFPPLETCFNLWHDLRSTIHQSASFGAERTQQVILIFPFKDVNLHLRRVHVMILHLVAVRGTPARDDPQTYKLMFFMLYILQCGFPSLAQQTRQHYTTPSCWQSVLYVSVAPTWILSQSSLAFPLPRCCFLPSVRLAQNILCSVN